MYRRYICILVGLVGGLLIPRSLYAQEHEEHHDQASTEVERVAAVIEATFAATEEADYAALDSLYAGDDLTIIEGAGIDRTWTEYRDHHLKPELEEFESFTYRPREIEARVGGDWAWAIFEYDLEIKIGERDIDRVGRGTAILERRNGRWVIRHMQTANRPRQSG
jgi:ketosteroid isomerase-like protein